MPLSEPANLSIHSHWRHSFEDQQTQLQNWLQFSDKKLPLAPNSLILDEWFHFHLRQL